MGRSYCENLAAHERATSASVPAHSLHDPAGQAKAIGRDAHGEFEDAVGWA